MNEKKYTIDINGKIKRSIFHLSFLSNRKVSGSVGISDTATGFSSLRLEVFNSTSS